MDITHLSKFYSNGIDRFGFNQNPWRQELRAVERVLRGRIIDPGFRKKVNQYRRHILDRIKVWDMCASLSENLKNDHPNTKT